MASAPAAIAAAHEPNVRSILIVDDDLDFAEALEDLLEPSGYRLERANDFLGAVRIAREFVPNVVFVDVRLGNRHGIDLIPEFKHLNPEVMCVVMTAYSDTETAIDALKNGAYDFLRKPLDPLDVSSVLERAFDHLSLLHEKEAAEHSLRESEERFRSLVEGSLQGIVIHEGLKPLFVNQAFAEIFGFANPEALLAVGSLEGLLELDDLTSDPRPQSGEAIRQAPVVNALDARRRDGTPITVEYFSHGVEWRGRKAFQGALIDITRRVQLEDQLRQAQKMEAVGQLAGGVAHDINNMLQIVRGFSELAIERNTNEQVQKSLERVLKAANAASGLTRQLLAFSRKEVLRRRNLDAKQLIHNLMDMLGRTIDQHIDLKIIDAGEPSTVHADSGMLEQVLVNLCVNARDAMPAGGTLTIETLPSTLDADFQALHAWAEDIPYVEIRVTDTGQGMPEAVLTRIFEPFFTTKGVGQGTGLGLAVAYGIIEQHGGGITVHSEVGSGTRFSIFLPAAEGGVDTVAAPEEAPRTQAGAAAARRGTETLLVVEDDHEVRTLLVGLLESAGYRVIQAVDGVEALARMGEHGRELHLVVLDMIMPRMGGREVYERMRKLLPDVPVLFSTGYTADALDSEFAEKNEFALIQKPYAPDELYRVVRELLDGVWVAPLRAAE